MSSSYFVFLLVFGPLTGAVVSAADTWCFRFTWLGPSWGNNSQLNNSTCEDFENTPPCRSPLVITTDQTPPNTTYMWNNYETTQIACPLTRGTVCLKYSIYYNGHLENITYMCGKMTRDGTAVTSGCESMNVGPYTTEACACVTLSPSGLPCNKGPSLQPAALLAFLAVAAAATLLASRRTV